MLAPAGAFNRVVAPGCFTGFELRTADGMGSFCNPELTFLAQAILLQKCLPWSSKAYKTWFFWSFPFFQRTSRCQRVFSNFGKISSNIWLEDFALTADSKRMNVSGQADASASRVATARFDRESTNGTGSVSWFRSSKAFRLTTIFKIPVGYEDETGFHKGEPSFQANSLVFQPEIGSTSTGTSQY